MIKLRKKILSSLIIILILLPSILIFADNEESRPPANVNNKMGYAYPGGIYDGDSSTITLAQVDKNTYSGIIFPDIEIPGNATIDEAILSVYYVNNVNYTYPCSLNLKGIDESDPLLIWADRLYSGPFTSSQYTVNLTGWDTAGYHNITVTNIIAELIQDYNWSSGDNIALRGLSLAPVGPYPPGETPTYYRYDIASNHDPNSNRRPYLYITYNTDTTNYHGWIIEAINASSPFTGFIAPMSTPPRTHIFYELDNGSWTYGNTGYYKSNGDMDGVIQGFIKDNTLYFIAWGVADYDLTLYSAPLNDPTNSTLIRVFGATLGSGYAYACFYDYSEDLLHLAVAYRSIYYGNYTISTDSFSGWETVYSGYPSGGTPAGVDIMLDNFGNRHISAGCPGGGSSTTKVRYGWNNNTGSGWNFETVTFLDDGQSTFYPQIEPLYDHLILTYGKTGTSGGAWRFRNCTNMNDDWFIWPSGFHDNNFANSETGALAYGSLYYLKNYYTDAYEYRDILVRTVSKYGASGYRIGACIFNYIAGYPNKPYNVPDHADLANYTSKNLYSSVPVWDGVDIKDAFQYQNDRIYLSYPADFCNASFTFFNQNPVTIPEFDLVVSGITEVLQPGFGYIQITEGCFIEGGYNVTAPEDGDPDCVTSYLWNVYGVTYANATLEQIQEGIDVCYFEQDPDNPGGGGFNASDPWYVSRKQFKLIFLLLGITFIGLPWILFSLTRDPNYLIFIVFGNALGIGLLIYMMEI